MKRIKFLKGIADSVSFFEPGQIVEMADGPADTYLSRVYDDGSRLAIEIHPKTCPNCGTRIEETQGPAGAPEMLEAATVGHSPRRR